MRWIGQHIYDLISRFRNDVYLEDISTGTIASGGNLGLDSNNKIVKASEATGDITGVTAGTNLTGGGTSGAVTINLADASTSAKGAASFSSDNFAASSGAITIKDGGVDLAAEVTGVLPSANMDADTAHLTGTQTFSGTKSFDAIDFARFYTNRTGSFNGWAGKIHVADDTMTDGATSASGTNSVYAEMRFRGTTLAATNASVTTTSACNIYIDAVPTAGTNQTITNSYGIYSRAKVRALSLEVDNDAVINGDIDLEGDIDVNGTLETDALTIGGAAVLAQATSSAVGAVELATTAEAITGTDTARAVTPAGLKARVSQIINLKGYATLQDGVYDFAKSFQSDDEAPFQLDESYGSGTIDSSTKVNQKFFFRANGFHVPFACTLSSLQVQVSCGGDGDPDDEVTVALVEYRPSELSGNQSEYPRTVYAEVIVDSNDNHNKIKTVSVADGSLASSGAIPAGSHLLIMIKGDSGNVGGTAVVSLAAGLSW